MIKEEFVYKEKEGTNSFHHSIEPVSIEKQNERFGELVKFHLRHRLKEIFDEIPKRKRNKIKKLCSEGVTEWNLLDDIFYIADGKGKRIIEMSIFKLFYDKGDIR